MYSIKRFVREFEQPGAGYLPRRIFSEIRLTDGQTVHAQSDESVPPDVMDVAVGHLSRVMIGLPLQDVFDFSIMGATIAGYMRPALYELGLVRKADFGAMTDREALAVFRLASCDVLFRSKDLASLRQMWETLTINAADVHDLNVMLKRLQFFLAHYGPVLIVNGSFDGGYTEVLSSGTLNFMTPDIIWDIDTSMGPPDKEVTFELLCCYLLGRRSTNTVYHDVLSIGTFNPRIDALYLLDVSRIERTVLDDVYKHIGC